MSDNPRGPGSEMPALPPADQANLWQVIWQRKTLLALGTLLGLGMGALLSSQLPPVYQATAQVLVVKKRPDAVTGVDTRQLSFEEDASTHQELLKSTVIIERALHKRRLQSLPTLAEEKGDLSEAVRKGLTVSRNKGPEGKSTLLQLAFRGKTPEDCRAILNALLDSYQEFLDKKYRNNSDDTLELIIRERDALRKELAHKETTYREFREKCPLLGKGRDGLDLRQKRLDSIQAKRSALLLRHVELQGQLAAVEAALNEGRSRTALLAMVAEFSSKGDADDPRKDRPLTLQDQLFPLLLEEQKLRERYGPRHPDVKAIRQRIAVARALILRPPAGWGKGKAVPTGDLVALHIQLLRQKLNQTRIAEGLLANLFESEHAEARKLASYEIQDESFRTGIALTKQLYEGLIKRLRGVNLARGVGGYDVQIIVPPAAGLKVAPRAVLILLVAGLLGTLAGLGLAYLLDSKDRRFRSSDETCRRLGLPGVGYAGAGRLANPSGSPNGLESRSPS